MITKVLIAEDHESVNVSLQRTLEELNIEDIHYAFYCDDAFTRLRNSRSMGAPYDLLITDLHFEKDGNTQELQDGVSLIEACRGESPELKVIVFSAESKPSIIQSLFEIQGIDGYVRKSRSDSKELRMAIDALKKNQRYFPRHLIQQTSHRNSYKFTDFDVEIISLLASGVSQKNIPSYLQEKGIRPTSLSSVEKRLNLMKQELECAKNEQLVAFCKDMGVI